MKDEAQHQQQQQSDRVFGERIAVVVNTGGDPDRLLRVQVRVYGLHSDRVPAATLPWAEYKLPVGARANSGDFSPAEAGDYVWVDFPYFGDPRRPRITGGVHHAPGKAPNLPHEAWAGPDKLIPKTTGEEPAPPEPEYHKSYAFTRHGVTLQVNPDSSCSVTQRATGTAFRIDAEGNITIHGEKNIHVSAIADAKLIIEGNVKATVTGKTEIVSMGKIYHDGGSGDLDGNITGRSMCHFTGRPHGDPSTEVHSSKGG